jgi:hypothetical protein
MPEYAVCECHVMSMPEYAVCSKYAASVEVWHVVVCCMLCSVMQHRPHATLCWWHAVLWLSQDIM